MVPAVPGSDGDLIGSLVRRVVGPGYRVVTGAVWVMAVPAGWTAARHGWKLHVSSRPATFPGLVEVIVPVLAAEGCAFKVASSSQVLAGINEGITSPAAVGKAVTIYPAQDQIRELGHNLARLLEGWQGPRILSDRRVASSAPVYYRYGAFLESWKADQRGWLMPLIHGPDGEEFDGQANLEYRQPPWAVDPFTGRDAAERRPSAARLLGGRYQITTGLREAASGNVYRAVDQREGRVVILKQARAFVGEDKVQADARRRVRNERRVLQALDGVPGVPQFVDHFRHADDEFLVTTDCGAVNLAEDVLARGPYRAAVAGPRSLGDLAVRLARILAGLHGRGVIMRDLCPGNVVIGEAGACIADFGISAYDGLHLPGATPAYAPPRQLRDEPPVIADDYFALGMTLQFAASGVEPVRPGGDPGAPRTRALQAIRRSWGPEPGGIMGIVADLLDEDGAVAAGAFKQLVSGVYEAVRRPARPLPALPAFTAEVAAQIAGTLCEDLLGQAAKLLVDPPHSRAACDGSIYEGSAGLGLELLQHPSSRRATSILADLAGFTAAAASQVSLPPGLFTGTTGISVFLTQAASWGLGVPCPPDPPGPDWEPGDNDLMAGAAGVGLGHLWLYQASNDPAHLAVALACGRGIVDSITPAFAAPAEPVPAAGVDPEAGLAHGLAGVTTFLLALARHTGDPATLAAAAEHTRTLTQRTRRVLDQVRQPPVTPIAMSWCQGLSGIGQTLLYAAAVLGDPALTSLARQAADVCLTHLPMLGVQGRCCGATGVGNFLIDLALTSQDERYWQAAHEVGLQLLLRSNGPPDHPTLTVTQDRTLSGWSLGLTGVLGFLRRLTSSASPSVFPIDSLCLPPW